MRLEVITQQPNPLVEPHPTPLLFVHGLWLGAWAWEETFLPYFAERGYTVHALSLTAHGGSPGNIRWLRSGQLIRDVIEVAQSLPTPPILIGHSMGGYLVQKVLERFSAPAGVLVASVPHYGAWNATVRFVIRHPLQFVKCTLTLNMRPVLETLALTREHLYAPGTPDSIVLETFARVQDDSYFLYLDILAFNLPRPSKVKTPLLVLGGTADGIFKPHEFEATRRRYGASASSKIFPNMGHNLMRDVGWEHVAETIVGWLHERG